MIKLIFFSALIVMIIMVTIFRDHITGYPRSFLYLIRDSRPKLGQIIITIFINSRPRASPKDAIPVCISDSNYGLVRGKSFLIDTLFHFVKIKISDEVQQMCYRYERQRSYIGPQSHRPRDPLVTPWQPLTARGKSVFPACMSGYSRLLVKSSVIFISL